MSLNIEEDEYSLPVEVFAEVNGPVVPPTREEFRALCDRFKTEKEICQAVKRGDWGRNYLRNGMICGVVGVVILLAAWHFTRRKRDENRRRSAPKGA